MSFCNAQKHLVKVEDTTDNIIYILPNDVNVALSKAIKNTSDSTFFYLSTDSNFYILYISHYRQKDAEYHLIKNTHRMVFVNGSLYPVIFDFDEVFGTLDSYKSLQSKYLSEEYPLIKKVYTTFEGSCIKFNKKGEVLEDGSKR